jgi:hypothetical protein
MVARFDNRRYTALDSRQTIPEQRHAALAAVPLDAVEAAFRLFGENYGKLALGFR